MWTPFDPDTISKDLYKIRGTGDNGLPFEWGAMYPNGDHFHRTEASPAPAQVPFSQVAEVMFDKTLEEQFASFTE